MAVSFAGGGSGDETNFDGGCVMATEYYFHLTTPLEPQKALDLLVNENQFEWGPDQSKVPQIGGYGLWVPAIKPYASTQSLYEENFGFRPMLSITFRIQSKEYGVAIRAIVRCVMTLLKQSSGDAILDSNGSIILQRIKGELLIHEDRNPLYMELFLAEVTLPYKLCELSQPLLGD